MADFFCNFLDFRSLITNYNFPLFLPSKHYCSSALHSHNSRISRVKRRPLHLTLLSKPPSLDFDVISTHEHSDGSILFRFGDPSEVAKNAKMEESKTAKEVIQGEGEIGSSAVKIVKGDKETEVIAEKADREVTGSGSTEVADHTNSVVSSSKTIAVVEGESESCERLLEGSNNNELSVLTSSKEMKRTASGVDIEHTENAEESRNEEYKDSGPVETSILDESSKVESNIATVELSDNETADITSTRKGMEVTSNPAVDIEQTGNEEEGLSEEYKDSPVGTPILDNSSEVVNNNTTVALLEKETAGITATPDIDVEHGGNVVEGLDEEHEESRTANATEPKKSHQVENNTTISLELSEKETAEVTSMTDPIITVPDNDVLQSSLETAVTTDVSPVSEHQNVQTEMKIETTENGRESSDSNLVAPSQQSGPSVNLSKEIEEQNLQDQMQKVAVQKGGESDMNDIVALEMQNVIGNGNASDTSDAEAEAPPSEAAMNWPIGSADQASGAGGGMPNETIRYVIEKDMIQLMAVPPQLDADSMPEEEIGVGIVEESSMEDDESENLTVAGDFIEASSHESTVAGSISVSQEMLITNFVLSSGAALLPHPSKALTGGEDAYFVAGQTWLGVADGVGQWSLKGTNPGVYAQQLIKNCQKVISDCNGDSINNPVELLDLSVAKTDSPGISTVLIAQFDGQALHVANVGDSGFIVLRHGAVYKRSSPMHHVFHFPQQIERGDEPSSLAEVYRVDLEKDDVIIIATDGLLDNLYDREISSIVREALIADKSLQDIAELLATKAQEIGSSASVRSPFADDAQAAGFAGCTGGKLDDVAVIVSVVRRQSLSQTL